MKRQPYPLQWPSKLQRTLAAERKRSAFGGRDKAALSPHATGVEVCDELALLGASSWVITSNLPSRGPVGIPYADAPRGDDPGVAVWFEYDGLERVLACDRWRRPEENLRAIAKSIEAMRGLERWGVADVLASVFTGFALALPPGDARPWRDVLGGLWPEGMEAADVLELAKGRHRPLMKEAHPDAGGDTARVAALNTALDAAIAELSSEADGG